MKRYLLLIFLVATISCEDRNEILSTFSLNKDEMNFQVGEIANLSVERFYPAEPSSYTVEWQSTNPSVVSVVDGKLTAISQGVAYISAIIENVQSSVCEVIVKGVYDEQNDVYISGSSNGDALYWKNGIPIYLTNGGNLSNGMAIYIENEDVYIAGYENYNAAYWKNNEKVLLSTSQSMAYDITVYNSDVYVVGYDINKSNSVQTAALWKNGVRTFLTGSENLSIAKSVYVNNNDVFVVGFKAENKGDNIYHEAKLWKNGIEINLTNQSMADAYYVDCEDNNIYIAGRECENGFWKAKYWRNENEIVLSSAFAHSIAKSITVKNDNLYIAGYTSDSGYSNYPVVTLWENGVEYRLSDKEMFIGDCKLDISGDDVYVLANEYYENQDDQKRIAAKYWKNKKEIIFEQPGQSAIAYDIVTVPKKK